jgi:Domain of unknown function (DUF5753)
VFEVLGPTGGQLIAELEASADAIREFQPVYVLARLRTPEYQTYLMAGAPQSRTPSGRVAAVPVSMVMTESALRWRCAPPAVLAHQMRHLLTAVDATGTDLSIVPERARMPKPMGHAFHLYGDRAVVVGVLGAKLLGTSPSTVSLYRDAFDALRVAAVSGGAAAELIRQALDDYETKRRGQ